jgi:hypothetical protein
MLWYGLDKIIYDILFCTISLKKFVKNFLNVASLASSLKKMTDSEQIASHTGLLAIYCCPN